VGAVPPPLEGPYDGVKVATAAAAYDDEDGDHRT